MRVVASLGLAFAVGQAVAAFSTEVRPFQAHAVHQLIPHAAGPSLPSDHATAAFAVAFAVGAFLSRRWGLALSVLAAVIGFARVWTGVHYPGDILAGALIAAGAVATIGVVGRAYDRRTGRRLGTTA
ncbi:phosphatase PAP2 family protein [Micromonospora sp. WMMD975]|uniref:phosphatase PAP2 family protein n=1 Tax=Micromonospora sp. WMMD975 TaxID=3016087 RepID=UPI00249B62DD|nr:phosphatase PAP2 family protein [Micromonospora sp. WMMD975]WFE32676.1 phosphatase PAP2 family protein [Micromonospora sp. WMMD975]